MIRYIVFISLFFCGLVYSLSEPNDSIYVGRKCNIVLYNTFQTDGEIISVGADSIVFKGEFGVYTIPRNQIKSVNVPVDAEEEFREVIIPDTTDYCDVYLEQGFKYTDVKLMKESDTAIVIVKKGKVKSYKIAEIRKIAFTSSGFGNGFLWGLGIGTALSSAYVLAWGGELFPGIFYCALFAVPIGVVGGIIGAVTARDDVYYFEKGYSISKAKRINYLIEKHKQ